MSPPPASPEYCASRATNCRTDSCSISSAPPTSPSSRHSRTASSASAGTGMDRGWEDLLLQRGPSGGGALLDGGDTPRHRLRAALAVEPPGVAVQRPADVVRERDQRAHVAGEADRVAEQVVQVDAALVVEMTRAV